MGLIEHLEAFEQLQHPLCLMWDHVAPHLNSPKTFFKTCFFNVKQHSIMGFIWNSRKVLDLFGEGKKKVVLVMEVVS
jgi:hypothetical protein